MSAKQKAVEDIKKLGRMLKGIIDVAEELESMASIEQASVECMQRLEQHKLAEKAALADLADVNAKLEEAKAKVAQIVSDARKEAAVICDSAAKEVDERVALGDKQLEEIGAECSKMKKLACQEVEAEAFKLQVLKKEVASQSAALKTLHEEVRAFKAKFI